MDFLHIVLLLRKIFDDVLKVLFIFAVLLIFPYLFIFGISNGIITIFFYLLGFCMLNLFRKHFCNMDKIISFFIKKVVSEYYYKQNVKNNIDSDIHQKLDSVLIPSDIDEALNQLLNRILDQYVSNWSNTVSSDFNFQHEIRLLIRNAISITYRRAIKIKIEKFILEKILPLCSSHLKILKNYEEQHYIPHLHIAVHNRKSEILYLQNMSKCLLKHILPVLCSNCKSYKSLLREILSRNLFFTLSDVLCNPNILNQLILRLLTTKFHLLNSEEIHDNLKQVELLKNFVSFQEIDSCFPFLHPDLKVILKETDLRNIFMEYLKLYNSEHLLQFCVDVECFNEKMLKLDLSAEELDNLYRDAWDLYSVYFYLNSPNHIKFRKDYASSLRKALSKDVLKLRTSTALFEAYEHVYAQLDTYCFDFHASSKFYSWLYGRCNCLEYSKSDNGSFLTNSPTKESFGRKAVLDLSNKISKIKDALKPNAILEGQLFDTQTMIFQNEISLLELGEDVQSVSNNRNMADWKITISAVGSRLDPVTNKAYTVFVVHVQNKDKNDWLIERRPADFYLLNTKLFEFHGNFSDIQLSSRRLLTTRLESIQLYENYMNKLIKNPILKNSELLYTFLTSTDDFGEDSSFSKLFRKSVVPVLRKERGQNLEVFINSFINSCKTQKFEWEDIESAKPVIINNSQECTLYENNFNIDANTSEQIFFCENFEDTADSIFIKPFSSIIFIGINVYNVQMKIVKVLLTLIPLFGKAVDEIMEYLVGCCSRNILTPCNVTYLINSIEWAIFDNKIKSNPEQIKTEINSSLDKVQNKWLKMLFILVYESLQDPKMNKLLFYRIVDAIMRELFPEIDLKKKN